MPCITFLRQTLESGCKVRAPLSGLMLWNTKARYQNSVQLFISSIQCKFQPSLSLTIYLEFSSFAWQKTIAFIEASAFADQLLIC